MSLRRLFRYIIGVLIAFVLLALLLPLAGISKSKFLPPYAVYATAQGKAVGVITGKYYEETGNPFRVGAHIHFLNYVFRAHQPPPRGSDRPGPVQKYGGTVRVDQDTYDQVKAFGTNTQTTNVHSGTVIPAAPGQKVRVKYAVDYPDINGIDEAWGSRNVGPGSNILSGWLIFIVIALGLGYLFMLLLEHFGVKEEI